MNIETRIKKLEKLIKKDKKPKLTQEAQAKIKALEEEFYELHNLIMKEDSEIRKIDLKNLPMLERRRIINDFAQKCDRAEELIQKIELIELGKLN